MWREVLGVETTLINEEFQVLLTNMREAKITEVFRSSWMGDYNDANTFLSILQSDNPANMPRYASDEFDELMERAGAQVDPAHRPRPLAGRAAATICSAGCRIILPFQCISGSANTL